MTTTGAGEPPSIAPNQRRRRFGVVAEASFRLLAERAPEEAPILGGPARIDSLDREVAAVTIARVGRDAAIASGIDVFDSDWLGTTEALYYVSPAIGSIRRWPWHNIDTVRVVSRKFGLANYVLEFRSPQTPLTLVTGRRSARRLITLHAACKRYRR